MQKPLALFVAVCLGLTGCQVFQKSQTWEKVVRVRPGETTKDPDPSTAYAAKLHRALADHGVEHKVVTYQYRYLTHLREEAVGTRTAVIYRDATNSKYPWWLKDDRLGRPVWLPNGELNKQIAFYIRREAEVLDQKNYSGGGASNKAVLAAAHPAAAPRRTLIVERRSAVSRIIPVQKAPELVARPVIAKAPAIKPVPAKEPVATKAIAKAPAVKPSPTKEPTPRQAIAKAPVVKPPEPKAPIAKAPAASEPVAPEKAITKIHFRATAPAPDRTPANEILPPPPIASHSPAPWAAPTELAPGKKSREIAPVNERLKDLFREKNGTPYDMTSPGDRRKMEKLRRSAAASE